jgi:hypothetical protein
MFCPGVLDGVLDGVRLFPNGSQGTVEEDLCYGALFLG